MMLNVKEAAERLKCNPETIRRWCREGRIPYIGGDRKNGYLVDADIISRCRLFLKGGDPTRCARCGTMGDRLYSLRKSKAKTITDASYDMRMDPNDLSRFERNMKNPSLKVLRKLAKYYGVTTDYILCMDLYEEEFE